MGAVQIFVATIVGDAASLAASTSISHGESYNSGPLLDAVGHLDRAGWLFLIIGVIVGALFALDGWWGNLKKTAFKNSPRMKNLLYVLGSLVVAIFVDFRKYLGDFDSGTAVLCYIIGGFFSAVSIIIGLSLAAFIRQIYLRWTSAIGTLDPFGAAMDCFVHGYQAYRDAQREYEENELVKKIRRQLEFSSHLGRTQAALVCSLHHLLGPANEQAKQVFVKDTLLAITVIVAKFFGEDSGLVINANYMYATDPASITPEMSTRVKFAGSDLSKYSCFLILDAYAHDSGRENFILPVGAGTTECPLLPGAPAAFFFNSKVIINDTSKITFQKGFPKKIKDSINEYFQRKATFRSFACFVVFGTGRPIGVVNIEANRKGAFGDTPEKSQELADLLSSTCNLIGVVKEMP
jgi:hypothetical protein